MENVYEVMLLKSLFQLPLPYDHHYLYGEGLGEISSVKNVQYV